MKTNGRLEGEMVVGGWGYWQGGRAGAPPAPEPPLLPVRKLKEVLWNWRDEPGELSEKDWGKKKGNASSVHKLHIPEPRAAGTTRGRNPAKKKKKEFHPSAAEKWQYMGQCATVFLTYRLFSSAGWARSYRKWVQICQHAALKAGTTVSNSRLHPSL